MKGSFATTVYRFLKCVSSGKVTTYGALAARAGHPGAARAVGQIMNRNPHPIRVPCHRVVMSDGRVGGYARGVRAKIQLLRREGITIRSGRIQNFRQRLFHFVGSYYRS